MSGSRLGDGTKVVDEIEFAHTNTGIPNGKSVVGLVWNDLDEEVWLAFIQATSFPTRSE